MIASKRWIAMAALLALAGCGGPEAPPVVPAPQANAGGEQAPARPTGPPASYAADARVIVRIDMEAVRGSTLANDIGSLVRSYPTWRELLGSSGIDPVRDFDRVLVAAPAVVSDHSLILIRHHLGNAHIRDAVLQMAVAQGERPEWRDVEGFPVVDWPAETEVPRVVVLTSENELVVTTPDDLDRAIAVARDHAARRSADDELIEPALALDDGLIATVQADEVGENGRRIQHPPEAFRVTIRQDGEQEGRIVLSAQGTYADDQHAEEARQYFTERRDFYAGQMLVRAVGLDRALREANIEAHGNTVDVRASMTEEEIQRVLGLLALGQVGGG
jgi:hypothetical protein